jgi:hypothetical protein
VIDVEIIQIQGLFTDRSIVICKREIKKDMKKRIRNYFDTSILLAIMLAFVIPVVATTESTLTAPIKK